MANKPMLSLCMIVKNEEHCIGRCLQSVRDYVDEMIIVDTGSVDRTVSICESFGANVYAFPWNGSFADARNYGLEHATGDWILWLDADEEADHEDICKLRSMLDEIRFEVLFVRLLNYYGEKVELENIIYLAHPRLFRNRLGLKFTGNIHETLHLKEHLTAGTLRTATLSLKIYHYGYTSQVIDAKGKSQRNIGLLHKEVETDDRAPWPYVHLATEYYRLEQLDAALEFINKSIIEFLRENAIPPAWVYKVKYSILVSMRSWENSLIGVRHAVSLYPDYVDLQCYLGTILYNLGMYEDALNAFERCTQLGEHNWKYMITKGIGSFYAWFYKGQCYEKMEHWSGAAFCYIHALRASNSFVLAQEALMNLVTKQNVSLEQIPVLPIDTNYLESEDLVPQPMDLFTSPMEPPLTMNNGIHAEVLGDPMSTFSIVLGELCLR